MAFVLWPYTGLCIYGGCLPRVPEEGFCISSVLPGIIVLVLVILISLLMLWVGPASLKGICVTSDRKGKIMGLYKVISLDIFICAFELF